MKSFGQALTLKKKKQPYQSMEEDGGPLTAKSNGSLHSFSSRYFSDEEVRLDNIFCAFSLL